MYRQTVDGQAAAPREQAAAQHRAIAAQTQAEMLRDQAQMMLDAARMGREAGSPFILRSPPVPGPSARREKMMFAGFLMVLLAAVVIFHPLVRAFARRLEGGHRKPDALDTGSAERLARIEQAVDAMAIEIERISEGQRFTTKLLSSRLEAPVAIDR